MKIVLTGGGTGGHFYPIIAVAQAIHEIVGEEKLLEPSLYYLAPTEYDKRALFETDMVFKQVSAGKRRLYFSPLNFFDFFKTGWGILKALGTVYSIYPDVVFAKGGYVSFPVLVAARILGIPVVIHESDSAPGRVNAWAGKFARRIALSYPQAAEFFPKDKVAFTGNPIRKELLRPAKSGAYEFLHLEEGVPVILILGGSQGSEKINQAIVDALPALVEKYQIIHQVGAENIKSVVELANVVLENNPHKNRYRPYDFLTTIALKMSAGAADIVVSRAGSTIFEIASWGIPSIIIPITSSNNDHQRKNAFSYARTGAAVVIEEKNLTDDILRFQIDEILGDKPRYEEMAQAAKQFAPLDAAEKIAREILAIALEHEG